MHNYSFEDFYTWRKNPDGTITGTPKKEKGISVQLIPVSEVTEKLITPLIESLKEKK
ncbi:MAG: hypothetical protein KGI11_09070 [Thaumarchaeota archaeon]|nr:hypothetical protein [Nitrososphaerota archaeon]